ncbi:MAG: helix-turn-helix transcriptional regulator [Flavobacteriaceae bacterium]|nr:helix-turn-helix transcriptional regulator [Flavobacteriaceae bacterium]
MLGTSIDFMINQSNSLGMDAFLSRSFSRHELKQLLKHILHKQAQQNEKLRELLSIQNPPKNSVEIDEKDIELMSELQTIILESKCKIKAEEIARKLFMSRSQLHRRVKSLTGKSLTKYSNHLKIKKAKHLLRTTRLQVKEIAFNVGFESSAYFIRIFKAETGTTPEASRGN